MLGFWSIVFICCAKRLVSGMKGRRRRPHTSLPDLPNASPHCPARETAPQFVQGFACRFACELACELAFHLFSSFRNDFIATEAVFFWCDIVEDRVVALMGVEVDKGVNLGSAISGGEPVY